MSEIDHIEASEIPELSKETVGVLKTIFVGLATIWERRGVKNPVLQVSELFFRPGEMLPAVEKIAAGQGTEIEIRKLRSKLKETEGEVKKIISSLDKGWNELTQRPDGLRIANEIGDLIHSRVGKMGIRARMESLFVRDPQDPESIAVAVDLLDDISKFNDRLLRLHQEVLKPASDLYN